MDQSSPDDIQTQNKSPSNPFLKTLVGGFFNWGIVLVGLMIDRGATALALILVAREVHPLEYGQYVACFGLATLLIVLPSFGMDAWLLTQSRSETNRVTSVWGKGLRLRVCFLVVWFVGMGFLSIILPPDTYPKDILFLTTLGAAFDSLILLSYSAKRATNRHWIVTIIQSLASLLLLLFVLLMPTGLDQILLFACFRTLLSAIVALITIGMVGYKHIGNALTGFSVGAILKATHPFFWAEFASSIYAKADINIIALMIGAVGTAVYGPALNILQVTFLPSHALFVLMVPTLSAAFVEKRNSFLRFSKTQFAVQLILGICLSSFLFAFAPLLVSLTFGADYHVSGEILRILSPIPLLRSMSFALGAVLASSKLQPQRTKYQIIVASFNLVAILIVIIPYGILGVAVVYILSELLLVIGYVTITYRGLFRVFNL